jgi:hypothetical protein
MIKIKLTREIVCKGRGYRKVRWSRKGRGSRKREGIYKGRGSRKREGI